MFYTVWAPPLVLPLSLRFSRVPAQNFSFSAGLPLPLPPAGSVFPLEKAVQLAHRPESDGPDKQRPAHQYQSFHKITSLKVILLQALFV